MLITTSLVFAMEDEDRIIDPTSKSFLEPRYLLSIVCATKNGDEGPDPFSESCANCSEVADEL